MTRLQYPVDRYLVESSNKFERANTIDDDLWVSEPALKPEDEIMLRKLHDMLQSTTNDLKILSGELSKFQEPGVKIKSAPMPLDDEFNEKVHIEELVNAKFHGCKLLDKHRIGSDSKVNKNISELTAGTMKKLSEKPKVSTSIQANTVVKETRKKKNMNLGISRTKSVEIEAKNSNIKLNNDKIIKVAAPAVAYNEFSYKYEEKKTNCNAQKPLQLQKMPSINIRSELKEQKNFNLSITPQDAEAIPIPTTKSNTLVISVKHEDLNKVNIGQSDHYHTKSIRKIHKMSAYESSESSCNMHVDINKLNKNIVKHSPKSTIRLNQSQKKTVKKDSQKRCYADIEEWKRKLNRVYGGNVSKNDKPSSKFKLNKKKVSPDKSKVTKNILNNTEYIPYSQLTLGGVRVSDIENEIADISDKDVPLSPIIDKILSSRDNSPRKNRHEITTGIFTTSDENLLQEVVDIEKTISETLSKNIKEQKDLNSKDVADDNSSNKTDSYADDFEDDIDQKEQSSEDSSASLQIRVESDKKSNSNNYQSNDENKPSTSNNHNKPSSSKTHNNTYTKSSNLSFKDSVDVFEFIHSIDTQDTGTQSSTSNNILPKETQTSPRNDRPNIQPIHNDLWQSIDPRKEVEKMFKLEKDIIKKLIIEEYGDILEKKLTKPSMSIDRNGNENNMAAAQKNTQTSPARVKSVMTSPRKTKTRTTSPFPLSLTANKQTSPIVFEANNGENSVGFEADDLGISINLSSPRFSLRLPQTTREVLSNLDACTNTSKNNKIESTSKTVRKSTVSSSSADADCSSSEFSSLGEVKMKLKKKLNLLNRSISSESSSSASTKYSSDLQSGGIIPLKSDGEISLGANYKYNRSIGETSLFLK